MEGSTLWALEILTETAHRLGDPERSARLWGDTQPPRQARGLTGSVSKLSQPNDLASALSKTLGETFEELAESGRRESLRDEGSDQRMVAYEEWALPPPSAFLQSEVEAARTWVHTGAKHRSFLRPNQRGAGFRQLVRKCVRRLDQTRKNPGQTNRLTRVIVRSGSRI